MIQKAHLIGILNITSDSFYDGGKYLSLDESLKHARQLTADGADIIDIGAQSTHPDSKQLTAQEEITVLDPVLRALLKEGIATAVDTYRPEAMVHCLELGTRMINDVSGGTYLLKADTKLQQRVAMSEASYVIMYSRATAGVAKKEVTDHAFIIEEINAFFTKRIAELVNIGISRDRLILDTGMGFFLGSNPEPSLLVLQNLKQFIAFGCSLYISTSHKSFIGTVLGGLPPKERGNGTLASELWAFLQGVNYIRTHEVKRLNQAIKLIDAIQTVR